MQSLRPNAFGIAVGSASAAFYLGCVIFMRLFGDAVIVAVGNALMHGVDISSILRTNIPLWESGLGLIGLFVLGWLFGALAAWTYNAAAGGSETKA